MLMLTPDLIYTLLKIRELLQNQWSSVLTVQPTTLPYLTLTDNNISIKIRRLTRAPLRGKSMVPVAQPNEVSKAKLEHAIRIMVGVFICFFFCLNQHVLIHNTFHVPSLTFSSFYYLSFFYFLFFISLLYLCFLYK